MCPNKILFDEQVALIGCASTRDPARMRGYRQQIAVASRLLAAHPYPHRPYDPRAALAGAGSQRSAR
jgi:hypothetical protein